MHPAVMVIDDEAGLARNIEKYLTRAGFDVRKLDNGSGGIREFKRSKPDLVLLDYKLPDLDGLEVLKQMRRHDPQVTVIMMTGVGGIDVAVAAMKAGAHDYLTKPIILKELKLRLEKAIGEARPEGKPDPYRAHDTEPAGLSELVGKSGAMRALRQRIAKIVAADRALAEGPPASVFITGETGTGKELVARAIHAEGPRSKRPFIVINCAAIPEHLLESELFGHEKGAFTDARYQKVGLVEAADGGTLFLDEIGDISPVVQVKLLRMLEDEKIRRVGSIRSRRVNVRIVSATNQALETRVREGQFRIDLYHRLRVIHIETPLLKTCPQDILLLAEHFLNRSRNRYNRHGLRLSVGAKEQLATYPWPGNVRELRNTIEQAVILAEGGLIDARLVSINPTLRNPSEQGDKGIDISKGGVDLEAVERDLLKQALDRAGGNVSKAAKLLRISRDTMRYRMAKFGLKAPGT
jgi:DNA-binding NtrC family response regulator